MRHSKWPIRPMTHSHLGSVTHSTHDPHPSRVWPPSIASLKNNHCMRVNLCAIFLKKTPMQLLKLVSSSIKISTEVQILSNAIKTSQQQANDSVHSKDAKNAKIIMNWLIELIENSWINVKSSFYGHKCIPNNPKSRIETETQLKTVVKYVRLGQKVTNLEAPLHCKIYLLKFEAVTIWKQAEGIQHKIYEILQKWRALDTRQDGILSIDSDCTVKS